MFNDLVVAGPAFWLFLVIHGQMARGAQAFGTVLDALERVAPRPDGSGLALGMARAYTGGFRSGLGHYDEAIALLTSGTELLREHVNGRVLGLDRKSTRLNSSHVKISYAVFCLKKKNKV